MMKWTWLAGFGLLTLCTMAEAETLYIGDTLRVGVRATQSDSSAALTVITTGAEVELIERKGGHMKVRTKNGVEGWIKSAYATSDKPASILLKEANAALAQLRASGATSATTTPTAAVVATDTVPAEEARALNREIDQLRKDNQSLRTQLQGAQVAAGTIIKPQPSPFDSEPPSKHALILYISGGVAFCFALGFLLGVSWHRGQVSKRLGGFSL